MARIRIPIVGGAYRGRSRALSPQECINLFPVLGVDGDKAAEALIGTPGLTEWYDFSDSSLEIRNMIRIGDYLWVVAGNTLYRFDTSKNVDTITGNLSLTSGYVFMEHDGFDNLMIVEPGTAGYLVRCLETISATFTADDSTDVITSSGHGLADGHTVRLTTTGTLPAGLSSATTYYVRDKTADTFKLAASLGGTAIDITDTGSGTHTWTIHLATVADTDMPTPSFLTWQDGYFIVGKNETGQFFISGSYDPTAWDASDYATAEAAPDDLIGGISHNRQLWLLGDETCEVWYNSGDADFPFDPIAGALFPFGVVAEASFAIGDNGIYWLSRNREGMLVVVRADGFNIQVVSTRQMEYQIAQYTSVSDAIGFCYNQEGHPFYFLTFPSGNSTWVWDNYTKEWHERRSYPEQQSGAMSKHRANCYAFFNSKHLVGDHSNGFIYEFDLDAYDDIAGNLISQRDTAPIHGGMVGEDGRYEGRLLRFQKFVLDIEEGVGVSPGTDKVTNGDFTADTTGWTGANGATLASVTGGKSGNCLRITGDGSNNPYVYQEIDVVEGRAMSLYAYVKAGTEATYRIAVWDISNGAWIFNDGDYEEAAGDWSTEYTNDFTIPADCSQVRVYLYQIASAGAGTTIFFDSVALYDTQSADPQVMLQWSDDEGNTWSNEHWRSMGQAGEYTHRAIWNRLGASRSRIFRIKISDPVKRVLVRAWADVRLGAG